MNRDIQLFIDGRLVEFNGTPDIKFTYQTVDFQNPTIVKNTFSKTIEVDGTAQNNKIFNEIWNLERVMDDGFTLFNPSQKVPFELFRNDEIVERGYAKLESIDRTGHNIVHYSISLFGGLGSFFYSLDYDIDSDRQKSLSDLNFMGEANHEDEFNFEISKETLHTAWDRIGKTNTGGYKKWDYINFAPCYNGYPENFDSSKVLMNTDNLNGMSVRYTTDSGIQYGTFPDTITNGGSGFTPKNGYIYGDLGKDLTEWETRDLRSYLQRPVLSVKGLFDAICRPENNGGYTVDLDEDFFSSDNPYYDKTWITLPLLDSTVITEEEREQFTWTQGEKITFDRGRNESYKIVPTTPFITTPNSLEFNVEVHATFTGCTANTLYNSIANTGYFGNLHGGTIFQVYINRDDNLTIYPQAPDAICGSNKFILATKLPDGSYWAGMQNHLSMPFGDAVTEWKFGKWVKVSGSDYVWQMDDGETEIKVTIDLNNINRIPMIAYFSKSVCNYSDMDNIGHYTGMAYRTQNASSLADALSKGYTYLFTDHLVDEDSYCVTNGGNVTRSYQNVTKRMLFGGLETTPCDWLLGYCKAFGLYLFKDKNEDIIYIRMRKNFYQEGVVDLADRIDRSKEMTINPLVFDSKWYSFNYAEGESMFLDNYYKQFNTDFGKQLVDTKYNFDSEEVDLLDGIVYRNGVVGLEKSNYFNNKYDTKNFQIPTVLYDWVKFKYYDLESTYETNMTLPQGATMEVINPNTPDEFYDIIPKLQLRDKDNAGTDGDGILLFFNGIKSTYKTSYYLTDDLEQMFDDSDNPCWLSTMSEWDKAHANRIAIQVMGLPEFSRYVVHNNTITSSLDFGRTRQLFVPYYKFNVDNTPSIYENYWKRYINDLYSVDTRKVEAYVNLDTNSVYDALKRFYWWDNSIWVMTEVDDYDICNEVSTKCTFVKVQDMDNYLHGVSYDDFYFNFYRVGTGNVPYSGNTQALTVDFLVSSSSDWYVFTGDYTIASMVGGQSVNAISGTAGDNISVHAVFTPNMTTYPRSVEFYGVNMETSIMIPIVVFQDCWTNSSHLFLSTIEYPIPSVTNGMTFMVLVYSSDPWSADCDADWVHIVNPTGVAGEGVQFNFRVDTNTAFTRNAVVKFSNGIDQAEFKITQAEKGRGSIEQDGSKSHVDSSGDTLDYITKCMDSYEIVPVGVSSAYTSCSDYNVELAPSTGRTSTITVLPNDTTVSRNIVFQMVYDGSRQKPREVVLPIVQDASGNNITNTSSASSTNQVYLGGSMPWKASTYETWITLNTTSGTASDASISYSVSANSGDSRVGYIYVNYTDEYGYPCFETIEVRQSGEGSVVFNVSPTTINAIYSGGTYMVNVTASTTCTASTTDSWIAIPRQTEHYIGINSFGVDPNEGKIGRIGHVTITDGVDSAVVEVLQQNIYQNGFITLTPPQEVFTSSGGTGSLTIYAEESWKVECNDEWITLGTETGSGATIMPYTASTNYSPVERAATITAYVSGYPSFSATTVVKQEGSEPEPSKTITYTSSDGQVVNPNNLPYVVSNTYYNGTGTIVRSRDLYSLNSMAFVSAYTLETINLPDTLESIGDSAFMWCTGLTGEMVIPDSVTGIGQNAFYKCRNITAINIPDGVTTINALSFSSMDKLTGITIPSSVTTVNAAAFEASGLVDIDIPSSVSAIGQMAFAQNGSMTSFTINNSTRLPYRCFYECSALTDIYCNTSTAPYISSNGQYAFENTPSGVTVHIPSGANYSRWRNDQYAGRWTYVEYSNQNDSESL